MGKSTISMGIFRGYVKLPEGTKELQMNEPHLRILFFPFCPLGCVEHRQNQPTAEPGRCYGCVATIFVLPQSVWLCFRIHRRNLLRAGLNAEQKHRLKEVGL